MPRPYAKSPSRPLPPSPAAAIQTRAARRAAPTAGAAAAKVFAALARKTKYADPELVGHWPTIAGKPLAALCRPGRITGTKTGRTLEVIVESGGAAAETQMRADDLLIRVNRFLGPGAVNRLVIRQHGARAGASARGGPSEGPSSPLGKALSSFRSAVARRNGAP